MILFQSAGGITPGTTKYFGISGYSAGSGVRSNFDPTISSLALTSVASTVPIAGKIRDFECYIDSTLGASGSCTIALVVNTVVTALAVTGGAGTSGLGVHMSNHTDEVSLMPGDLIALVATNSALSNRNFSVMGAFNFVPD